MPTESRGVNWMLRKEIVLAIRTHIKSKGPMTERKLDSLVHRWIAKKGYRAPYGAS